MKQIFINLQNHVRALEGHVGEGLFDVILSNGNYLGDVGRNSQWVRAETRPCPTRGPIWRTSSTMDTPGGMSARVKLAMKIIEIYSDKTGPLAQIS